ncbi:MAG: hypothetical protein OXN90_20350 [Gemmatimonadota bacterium]|nr:hypothetical protein [Gemmatimonadota bacterium]
METKQRTMREQEHSIQTELAFRKKGVEVWKTLRFSDTDELFIDNNDLESGAEYEARVRNRYLREDGSPLTQWGPWSPTSDFRAE